MLKRFSLLIMLCILATPVSAQLQLFACEPEWAALSQTLGGERVTVYSATHALQDPHHIQARPSLVSQLSRADLAVCTGAELEAGWMPLLQRRARNPGVQPDQPGYFTATDQVSLLERPQQLDRAAGHVHAAGNPHIQLDPRRLEQVAVALSQRLQQLDPAGSPYYQARLDQFQQRWQNAIRDWEQKAIPLRGKRAIVHHRDWIYLLDWLGIELADTLEPKPGVPPTVKHLQRLSEQENISWIIHSPLNDKSAAQWLSERTGTTVVELPHTVTALPGTDDLFSWMDQIITLLTGHAK